MICTSVVPCLSCDLVKNNKIMSMFCLFYRLFWPYFCAKMEGGGGEGGEGNKPYTKAVKHNVSCQFSKGTRTMFQNSVAILIKR